LKMQRTRYNLQNFWIRTVELWLPREHVNDDRARPSFTFCVLRRLRRAEVLLRLMVASVSVRGETWMGQRRAS
jgi:hypothetical protein